MIVNIAQEINQIICELKGFLLEEDFQSIQELVSVGEYAVAFENLCTQLYEYDVLVDVNVKERLEEIGTEMSLDRSLWEDLEH